MEVGDGHLFHQAQRVRKGLLRLAGEARHHVDPDGDAGDGRVELPDEVPEEGRIVIPAHRGEDPVVAALEGDVEVAADAFRTPR